MNDIESFHRTRSHVVISSAALLFLIIIRFRFHGERLANMELGGIASLIKLVEHTEAIPAALSVAIIYFCYRLIVDWHIINSSAKKARFYPADYCVPVAIAVVSLTAFACDGMGFLPSVRESVISNADDPENSASVADAGSPHTPASVLNILAKRGKNTVRQRVAGNRNTRPGVLKELAHDPEYSVRVAVAMNRNTPTAVVKELVDSQDFDHPEMGELSVIFTRIVTVYAPWVLLALLVVPVLPKLTTADFKNGRYGHVAIWVVCVSAVIGIVKISPKAWDRVVVEQFRLHKNIGMEVSGDLNASETALRKLARDPDVRVQVAVVENPNTPAPVKEEVLRSAAEEESTCGEDLPVWSVHVPSEVLTTLSSGDACVRKRVAEHRNTPINVLKKLLNDGSSDVTEATKAELKRRGYGG